MKEADLYRSVARVTGEPVRRLRRMGFTLFVPQPSLSDLPRTQEPIRHRTAVDKRALRSA